MGLGSYVIAEWKSIQKEYPNFQQSFMNLESQILNKCNLDWKPKGFNLASSFGMGEGEYGRTTILPGCFDDHYGDAVTTTGTAMVTWRQAFTRAFLTGNPTQFVLMSGVAAGEVIPEGVKIALMGFAFPNKEQHVSEIKFQIADTKYGRYNLEEMLIMDTPAIIFEEGFILDEEEAFHMYAHFDTLGVQQVGGTADDETGGWTTIYQRVVPIGALYYQYYNKVGGNAGASMATV